MLGDEADWTLDRHISATVADRLAVLIWQQTEDGHRKSPRHFPKPIQRPGQEDVSPELEGETKFGGKPLTFADVDAALAAVQTKPKRKKKGGSE